MHDAVYSKELLISNRANGYRDVIALIDLSTYRRIPWENNVPFFLVSFLDPETKEPLSVDPRGVLRVANERAEKLGFECFAGAEYEVSVHTYLNSSIKSDFASISTSKVNDIIPKCQAMRDLFVRNCTFRRREGIHEPATAHSRQYVV